MISGQIHIASAGSLAVASVALIFFVFQGWLAVKRPEFHWNAWGAVLTFSTAIYALAVFIQFNSTVGALNHFAELIQYSSFLIIVHATYGFTFAYLSLPAQGYHRILGAFHILLLIVLWTTPLIVGNEFVHRKFRWLSAPYTEPQLGVLGTLFLLYCACAGLWALRYWFRYRQRASQESRALLFGFLFWALLGVHDALATLRFQSVLFLMEYGFFGFSLAVMTVTIQKYVNLFSVAERRKLQLQSAHDSLEKRVAERTHELTRLNQRMNKEIQERRHAEQERFALETRLMRAKKMEALGTLAGGVAHDLNNILSGVVSYPELLLLDTAEDSELYKPLMTIKDSGEKAAQIVQDLLTLGRRGMTITEVVALNAIIDAYLESLEFKRLKKYHPLVDIDVRTDPDLLNITGSPIHLTKTVMNLISNAAESMPDGGRIVIETGNRYLDAPLTGFDQIAEGDYVLMVVSDTGVGISATDRERIFEPFYTKKKLGRSGTGLGMAVVWGTVKDHRGYIDVQSEVGRGSTFSLYFPASREALAHKPAGLSIDGLSGDGQTVLVVDDVAEQRMIASAMLEKLGYSVICVASGEKALSRIDALDPDLLVLDMIMDPGIDGLETYRRIVSRRPGQKAVIASGFSETARVVAAQQLGAGAYIRKPYTIENLALAIKETLAA